MPDIIIVAGPNGAGKTTFANSLRRLRRHPLFYVNADEIEAGLPPEIADKSVRALAAARLALQRLDGAVQAGHDLMIETTLAARTYGRKIPAWQALGYKVALVYLRLPSADHAVERVRRRVAQGGHNIPEDAVRRRFTLGLANLEVLYKPIVDEWYVWESVEGDFVPVEAWDLQ